MRFIISHGEGKVVGGCLWDTVQNEPFRVSMRSSNVWPGFPGKSLRSSLNNFVDKMHLSSGLYRDKLSW